MVIMPNDKKKDIEIGDVVINKLRLKLYGFGLFFLILTVSILGSGMHSIGPGERGVIFHSNGSLSVLPPGKFQFVMPVVNTVTIYNVQSQLDTIHDAGAGSIDGLDVFVDIAVQYHPDPTQITWIHQNIGDDYLGKVVRPAALEGLKSSITQYHALEVIRHRSDVKDIVEKTLQSRLENNHIILDQVSLTNIHYDPTYEAAISASQEKQQQLVTAQNEYLIAQIEANKTILQANAQASSIRLLANATSSQQNSNAYLFLQYLKTWDGKLPGVVSGSGDSLLITPPNINPPK